MSEAHRGHRPVMTSVGLLPAALMLAALGGAGCHNRGWNWQDPIRPDQLQFSVPSHSVNADETSQTASSDTATNTPPSDTLRPDSFDSDSQSPDSQASDPGSLFDSSEAEAAEVETATAAPRKKYLPPE